LLAPEKPMPKFKSKFVPIKGVTSRQRRVRRDFMASGAKARAAGLAARRDAFMRANAATMGFMGIEKKFYDTFFSGSLAVTADAEGAEMDPSATSMISTPDQGDGASQRDGKRITCKYLEIKGTLNVDSVELLGNPPTGNRCFIAVVLDTQSNGAQMNSEDCFKNTSSEVIGNAAPLRNLLFGNRFRILKSKTFEMGPRTISHFAVDSFSVAGRTVDFHWFIPLNDLTINFNAGTTASIANVIDNSLHVIGYSTAAAQTTTLTYNARLRFVG